MLNINNSSVPIGDIVPTSSRKFEIDDSVWGNTERYIDLLKCNIVESIINGEPFATSTSLTFLVKRGTRSYRDLVNYFRQAGCVVHAPPSKEIWKIAVESAKTSPLLYVRKRFLENQVLDWF